MTSHSSRLAKLENRQPAQALTWRAFAELDGEAFKQRCNSDPEFKAAWDAICRDLDRAQYGISPEAARIRELLATAEARRDAAQGGTDANP